MKRYALVAALMVTSANATVIELPCNALMQLPDQPLFVCIANPQWYHQCNWWTSNGMKVSPFYGDPRFPSAQVRCGSGTIKYNTILRVGFQGYLTWERPWPDRGTFVTEAAPFNLRYFTGKCPLSGAQLQ